MKLKNNLYKILSRETIAEKESFIIVLNPSCLIYAAHFPNMPITPGVCIIQMVEELLGELTKSSQQLIKIKNAKFLSVLKPEEQKVMVTFSSLREENGIFSSKAIISDSNNNVYAKVSLQTITA
jgi:3-hydroxyacyl-[acyl-carrier-protein] dehydratase